MKDQVEPSLQKVTIVGEMHQDIIYETTFFLELSKSIAEHLASLKKERFTKENLQEEVLNVIDDFPKKITGDLRITRGGNGHNSALLLSRLGIPVKLMTTIGAGAEWMLKELDALGIDRSTVFQVSHRGPISTIINDPKITKIFVAPNLKKYMNFEEVEIKKSDFSDSSIVFFTPIASKYTKVLELVEQLDIIKAATIETQKIENLEQLQKTLTIKVDLLFANLNDLAKIMSLSIIENTSEAIEKRLHEVDSCFQDYAWIRVYTLGKYGSWVCYGEGKSKKIKNIPIIPVEVKNRVGAGDTFAAGFIAYLYSHLKSEKELHLLLETSQDELLIKASQYATAAAALRVSKADSPSKEEVMEFYNKHFS